MTSSMFDQQKFHSFNGGFPMWAPRFADALIANGIAEFYRFAHEQSTSFSDGLGSDWHFLRLGIEALETQGLEALTAQLKGPLESVKKRDEEVDRVSRELKLADEEWQKASESVRHQLKVLVPWVVETVVHHQGQSFPWINDRHSRFLISLDYSGASAVLDSPQQLRSSRKFFEDKIHKIQDAIAGVYLEGKLPEGLDGYLLSTAISRLMDYQGKVDKLSDEKAKIEGLRRNDFDTYIAQRSSLLTLIFMMNDSAKVALFRICSR